MRAFELSDFGGIRVQDAVRNRIIALPFPS